MADATPWRRSHRQHRLAGPVAQGFAGEDELADGPGICEDADAVIIGFDQTAGCEQSGAGVIAGDEFAMGIGIRQEILCRFAGG